MRIHHEGRALRHAFLRIENPEGRRKLAFDIRQHGERQVLQVIVILPPGQMHELRIGAAAENLRVAIRNSRLSLPNAAISVGQTKVKSFGQKK